MTERPEPIPGTLDYRLVGCAFCKSSSQEELGPLQYVLPPPAAGLDARIDARLHDACYWRLVNIMRAAFGAPVYRPEDLR